MITLSADADISPSEDLYGKHASDLQEDIEIANGEITGTLHYLTDYTGFSTDASLQEGNYLALHFEFSEGAEVKATLTNEVTLDEDGIIVVRIADKDTQTLTVTASLDGETITETYGLSGLTCESSGG